MAGGKPQVTGGASGLQAAHRPAARVLAGLALLLGRLHGDAGAAAAQSGDHALAPWAITAEEIREIVAVLAHDSLEGRQAGTPGAERAAAYVAAEFERLGLRPAEGGYLQSFEIPSPAAGARARTANVIGVLAGSDPELRSEAVLVGAHYDHLGWGGAGSLAEDVREIHNGADDNASGVAGVLELAERFAADPPRRTLVFAAFGAEEAGNLGSVHYVHAPAWPLAATLAMLNLDMIGRPRERVTVYGTGTSGVWPRVLDAVLAAHREPAGGAGHSTKTPHGKRRADTFEGLAVSRVPDGFGPSDHASFYAAGVPVLAFFTGAHADYHRPSDDADRIDPAGAARVLRLVAAVLEEVANSTRGVPWAEAPVTKPGPRAFRVALGTMPDYAFAGPGVRLSAVRPGSPADRAGAREGDVVLRLAGREVLDVYAYTAALAELEAGEPVEMVVGRGAERITVTVTPEPR